MTTTSNRRSLRQKIVAIATAGFLTAGLVITAGAPASGGPAANKAADNNKGRAHSRVDFWLTVLHNNDGESQLVNAGTDLEDFGGIARFATLVKRLRNRANVPSVPRAKSGSITVSSGDNFLAGPEFSLSLERNEETGAPYYDSMALARVGYDAMAIGNHEFDFGPDVFATFIEGFGRRVPPFLSSNLNFDDEPRLKALEDEGIIMGSVVLRERGERIGVVGATTPLLPTISSPRNVKVDPAVAESIQTEVDDMTARGVDKIVLISHLQSIQEDLALAPELSNVDIMVAGGGDELLANPEQGDLLVPGDESLVFGDYPLEATDSEGRTVPVVTTKGSYTYVGNLKVAFDRKGNLLKVDEQASKPVRVAGGNNPDAVRSNPWIQRKVVDPIVEGLAELAENVVATTEVGLDGRRATVRTVESNMGNLVADALRWQADQLNESFGAPHPDIGVQNGGGIRNDSIIGPGDITELDTFDIAPFGNFVSVVHGVSPERFKELLEVFVQLAPNQSGGFGQISGFEFSYDPSRPAGSRVISAELDDGTVMIVNGAIAATARQVNIATNDFSARGGDAYPLTDFTFTTLGVTYQQALMNYLTDALSGVVTAGDYPEGGEGRITTGNFPSP
ncbi:MAG: bifunctional metallophosphatase/5'-nucleotidase [Actinomycetota bacterium]